MRTGRTPEQQKKYEYVTGLIASGLTNKQISEKTNISVRSIERYRRSMPLEIFENQINENPKSVRPGFWNEWNQATERLRKYYRRIKRD